MFSVITNITMGHHEDPRGPPGPHRDPSRLPRTPQYVGGVNLGPLGARHHHI